MLPLNSSAPVKHMHPACSRPWQRSVAACCLLAKSPFNPECDCSYLTIFAPAIHTVQQRLKLHDTEPARLPHQQDFAQKHLPALKQAAAALASPSTEVLAQPELAWSPFKAVSRAIAQQLKYGLLMSAVLTVTATLTATVTATLTATLTAILTATVITTVTA